MQRNVKFAVLLLAVLFSYTGYVQASSKAELNVEKTESAQQKRKITGVVQDDLGGVIGASVTVKGTSTGTMTNIDGQFTLDVAAGQTVVVSYLGYQTQEITISNQTSLTITLVEDSQLLDEVVVTALGLKREQKALGYAVTEIKGEDLSLTGINPVSSLQGKAAGVEISGSDGGMFGGTKILIRGSSTLSGNNQPIYVVDGVILDNNISGTASADWDSSSNDYGNELKNLNPDDFETITILKGAAATALYGSRGLNGAVVITTKGGGQYKGFGVSVTQSFGIDHVYATPNFQNIYGPGTLSGDVYYGETNANGTYKLWDNLNQFKLNTKGQRTLVDADGFMFGPRFDGQDIESYDGTIQPYKAYKNNYRDVYQLGFTSNTNVAIQGGTDKTSYYSSISYRKQNGTLQNNTFDRISFLLKGAHQISERVKMNASITMANSEPRNAAKNIGESFLNGVPRTYNTDYYKDKYRGDHGGMASTSYGDLYGYVPGKGIWWYLNEYDVTKKETVIRPVASVEVKIQDWLNFVADGNMNYYYSRLENKALGNGFAMDGGLYQVSQSTKEQTTLGGQFNVNKTINDFGISGFARFEYYNQMEQYSDAATKDGLIVPGQFFLDNSKGTKEMKAGIKNKKRMLSAIVSASFSWKNQLYLDVTGRNDWSSALVYTNATGNYSYFYPSVSASWLLNETFQLPEWVTLAKIRGSWAQVGNDTDPYSINQGYKIGSFLQGNGYIYTNEVPDVKFAPDLKPERKNAYEIGIDWRFLNSRIHLDATYYKENTKNQIMEIDVPFESGFRKQRINAGNIQNQGVEIALNTIPFMNKDWEWSLDFTYTKNENKIIDLHENVQSYIPLIGDVAYGNFRVGSVAQIGGAYGLLLSDKVPAKTESGENILTWNNKYRVAFEKRSNKIQEVGKVTPDFMGTVATGLRFKDISLRVLVDASFGGHIASYSNHYGTAYGYLETSLRGRDAEHGGITWTSEYADSKGMTFHDGVIPEGVIAGGSNIIKPDGSSYVVAEGGESFADLYERGIVEPVHASGYHYFRNNWGQGTVNDDWFHKRIYISLREITLGYRVPRAIANKLGATGINLGFTARNLGYLYNSLPNNLNPESVRGNDSREFRERQFSPFTASYMLTIGVNF